MPTRTEKLKWSNIPILVRVALIGTTAYFVLPMILPGDSKGKLMPHGPVKKSVRDATPKWANELHRVMDNILVTDREVIFFKTMEVFITKADWRYLNNYWTTNIQTQDHSLYEWVNDESYSLLPDLKKVHVLLLKKMAAAGLDY